MVQALSIYIYTVYVMLVHLMVLSGLRVRFTDHHENWYEHVVFHGERILV